MEFAYSNHAERPSGAWLRAASRVVPGIGRVQAQVGPYADAWAVSNRAALAASGPLWVALGDSLSQGVGASAYDRGWVGQLRDALAADGHPFRVVNLSVSGARIDDVTSRQVPALRTLPAPSLVTLLVGSNDLFRYRAGVADRFAELLRQVPSGTVVATLPNPTQPARAINATLEKLAPERDLVIAETRDPRTTRWFGKLAPDRFHPNDRGYASIAAVFADAVVPQLR